MRNAIIAANLLYEAGDILSDENMKEIYDCVEINKLAQAILNRGTKFNTRDIEVLVKAAGAMDDDHDFERDGHRWTNDVLNKYAEHVYNYQYTYKPEAQQIDPNIDPQEEHVGPMAQDLEQVNPAVVHEDPKTGYKTVDTGRLALMNAGAIADLAREIKELKHG